MISENRSSRTVAFRAIAVVAVTCLIGTACTEIQRPRPEQFYGVAAPAPVKQEFRWSNGRVPRGLDPARAAAAPETDLVRAVYEGLTELDGRTLEPAPALAEKWTSDDGDRIWTFEIRRDARWTNGKRVTAADVAASWQRVIRLGPKAVNRELFSNIVGANAKIETTSASLGLDAVATPTPSPAGDHVTRPGSTEPAPTPVVPVPSTRAVQSAAAVPFGVTALSDTTLQVKLRLPDKDFPKLVAGTVFRPIYGDGEHFETEAINNGIVTNGPFRVALVSKDGVSLERSETYWNKDVVRLDRVRLVAKETAEAALDAYKKGELDAVTNAELEPLAVKLLVPFEDFKQRRHSAVNLYEVNSAQAPYSDRRVREALAVSIDRDTIIDSELEGATEPASTLLPVGSDRKKRVSFDPARARDLMEKAGFPNGQGFPAVRLVVNRNDTQQRVARTVAQMWKRQLNIETQITVRETAEMDAVRASGEFDLIRRGIVLPTTDEMMNLAAILGSVERTVTPPTQPDRPKRPETISPGRGPAEPETEADATPEDSAGSALVTADEALHDLTVIPLYFPVSYALIKPYVRGFDLNELDAYELHDVSIDSDWNQTSDSEH